VALTSSNKKVIFFLIAGIVLAGIVILYAATFLPNSSESEKALENKTNMLKKQLATASRTATLQETIDNYEKRFKQDMDQLLPYEKSNEALAEIQKRLVEFADKSGVAITQRNTLADKKVGDTLTKVAVHIEASCDPEKLVKFLLEISNYERFLKVEEINLNTVRVVQRKPNPQGGGSSGGLSGLISAAIDGRGVLSADGRGSSAAVPVMASELRAGMTVVGYISSKPTDKPAGSATAAGRR
jgi:hypothetical protein